ncbi:hypothetical protein DFH08DRAFT_812278 [Mycena albidolilacea]|uniref:Uncharacterized protein n=1 Tax=Mycena albidolilacea TaxID=1033008 RepID=A0AAD6ZUA0_9AGAR|nr:hypothetical protein DFH08DRAFT_812278 [Mycena albidolilacea]
MENSSGSVVATLSSRCTRTFALSYRRPYPAPEVDVNSVEWRKRDLRVKCGGHQEWPFGGYRPGLPVQTRLSSYRPPADHLQTLYPHGLQIHHIRSPNTLMSPKTSVVRCRLRTCEKKTSFFPSALAQGRLGWPVSLKHSKPYKHAIGVGNVTAPLLSPFTQQVPLNLLLHLSNNSCSTVILGNLKQQLAVSAKDLQKNPHFSQVSNEKIDAAGTNGVCQVSAAEAVVWHSQGAVYGVEGDIGRVRRWRNHVVRRIVVEVEGRGVLGRRVMRLVVGSKEDELPGSPVDQENKIFIDNMACEVVAAKS